MNERTPLFYMANLASEVHRYFGFLEKKELVSAGSSRQRIFDIVKKLSGFESMEPRSAEIDALLSVIENPSMLGKQLSVTQKQLDSYFTPFTQRLLSV